MINSTSQYEIIPFKSSLIALCMEERGLLLTVTMAVFSSNNELILFSGDSDTATSVEKKHIRIWDWISVKGAVERGKSGVL